MTDDARQAFLGVELLTAPGVLVARVETELLARAAIEVLRGVAAAGRVPTFLDLCCGSGNLACAIAQHVPSARGWASDLTTPAVELARRNVARLGLDRRVQVLQGDLFAPLAALSLEAPLEAIVCNPPYISTRRLAGDRAALLEREPREAFDGGPYGLSVHQRVARGAAMFLAAGSPVLLEFGEGQDRQVVQLLNRAGCWDEPALFRDVNGTARVVMARRKGD